MAAKVDHATDIPVSPLRISGGREPAIRPEREAVALGSSGAADRLARSPPSKVQRRVKRARQPDVGMPVVQHLAI